MYRNHRQSKPICCFIAFTDLSLDLKDIQILCNTFFYRKYKRYVLRSKKWNCSSSSSKLNTKEDEKGILSSELLRINISAELLHYFMLY